MGNGVTRLYGCFAGTTSGDISRRRDDLGLSFWYVPPNRTRSHTPDIFKPDPVVKTTTFISGASVSANPSTASSATPVADESCPSRNSAFESSDRFTSIPIQTVPNGASSQSGRINPSVYGSGQLERRFLSGPIVSGLFSGKNDKKEKEKSKQSDGGRRKSSSKIKWKKKFITFRRFFMNLKYTISRPKKNVIEPINGSDSVHGSDSSQNIDNSPEINNSSSNLRSGGNPSIDEEQNSEITLQGQNLQWAQGKAGEDRVHVVVSEESGWVFVGIYDGFNGPDAPDYLLNNLYSAVHKELQSLLWTDKFGAADEEMDSKGEKFRSTTGNGDIQMRKIGDSDLGKENLVANGNIIACESRKQGKGAQRLHWRCEWDSSNNINREKYSNDDNHKDVLKALMQSLERTEEAYLELADRMVKEKPELALMGSCVLVMLMKGEDVYLMNVGDSRAVMAQKPNPHGRFRRKKQELERIMEDTLLENQETNYIGTLFGGLPSLMPIQLTMEHSTRVEEEVRRIKKEHPDDASAVENDRVKGYLRVTRAFGSGFLKQPKWNDALLEMFRINYVGTSPYITCSPSLSHHRLTSRDKFLILSSDGLYEYFSNQEVIFEVESFIAAFPEGDPAQHLIQEVLFRAAKRFGMDFHELLEIPQGERRRYHDDVSVIIISLQGTIWQSSI